MPPLNSNRVAAPATATATAVGCHQGRQWQKALVLLREMEVVDGLPGNLICYNAAADACGKVGHVM